MMFASWLRHPYGEIRESGFRPSLMKSKRCARTKSTLQAREMHFVSRSNYKVLTNVGFCGFMSKSEVDGPLLLLLDLL